MAFALTIAQGKGRGRRFRFGSDGVSIGRAPGNDVVLNHAAVSRVHARIERDGVGFVLLDRASANGVELNGAGIAGRAQLREGDLIAVGPVTFRFGFAPAPPVRAWRRMSRPARSGIVAALVLLASTSALLRWPGMDGTGGTRTDESPQLGRPSADRDRARGDPATARAAYERGRRKLEERRVAPRNLYDAWRSFLEAQRALETDPEPAALEQELAGLVAGCERDLRRECDALLFRAARFERYGQQEAEQRTWREAMLRFPGDDPGGCRRRAQQNLVSGPPGEGDG